MDIVAPSPSSASKTKSQNRSQSTGRIFPRTAAPCHSIRSTAPPLQERPKSDTRDAGDRIWREAFSHFLPGIPCPPSSHQQLTCCSLCLHTGPSREGGGRNKEPCRTARLSLEQSFVLLCWVPSLRLPSAKINSLEAPKVRAWSRPGEGWESCA